MRLPDDVYVVHQVGKQSMAFLDIYDAYAYANSLKGINNIRIFYDVQDELAKAGVADLSTDATITKYPLSKPRTPISCGN